jgi:PAS domain S-box-containing protein
MDTVNILIVDDKPQNIIALEAVLKSAQYNLISAKSGEEALKKALMYNFAVILLDVQMPGLNGFETAKIIKSREKSRNIPIIFVTAINKAEEHVLEGYFVGAVDYIFKPFNPTTLKMKIETFVQLYKSRRQIEIQKNMLEYKTFQLEETVFKLKQVEEEKKRNYEILERLVAERTRELSSFEKRFRSIFESSPNLIFIRACKDGRYLDANKSWEVFTGYKSEEIIGKSLDLFLPANEVWGKPLHNLRVSYFTKAGERRQGLLSTENIEIESEQCLLCVVTDITERVLMEREMNRLDRLFLVGEMAAGIAHEIRNPMTTVHGFLQTLQGKTLSADYVNLMLDELNRANSIITEFLNLAKNKKTDFRIQDLNAVIRLLGPLINAEALRQDKSVHFELNKCPLLRLDEKQIRQIILNLTLNGLEAMELGGELSIRTYADADEVVLEVADQGGGIDEKFIDKIGTPFFTTKDSGTGLGLAVCYSAASRHGANISLKTGPGGTTFLVRFKAAEMPVKAVYG